MASRTGDWFFDELFNNVGAAQAWHQRPSDLGLCLPEEDAAVMIAYSNTANRMRAYEQTLQEKEAAKAAHG